MCIDFKPVYEKVPKSEVPKQATIIPLVPVIIFTGLMPLTFG